jgi:hypothetical protein
MRLPSISAHVNASKRQAKTRKDHLDFVHVASIDIAEERQHCPCFLRLVGGNPMPVTRGDFDSTMQERTEPSARAAASELNLREHW